VSDLRRRRLSTPIGVGRKSSSSKFTLITGLILTAGADTAAE
jgi:hypothetical protein